MQRIALCVIVAMLAGCNSGKRQGTVEAFKNENPVRISTSQPTAVDVHQEVSAVKAQLETRIQTEVGPIKNTLAELNRSTYNFGFPPWIYALAMVLVFAYSWRNSYHRGRSRRIGKAAFYVRYRK